MPRTRLLGMSIYQCTTAKCTGLDYLKRLVEFALHDPDLSSLKHDRILAEIRQ